MDRIAFAIYSVCCSRATLLAAAAMVLEIFHSGNEILLSLISDDDD